MKQRWQEFKRSRIGELLGINTGCPGTEAEPPGIIGPVPPPTRFHALDRRIALELYRLANPTLSWWMRRFTDLASGQVTVPIALALVGIEAKQGHAKAAKAITVTWIGGLLLHVTVKLIYRRKRPALFPALTQAGGYSLPSGHTVTAVVTYGLVASALKPNLPREWQWLPATSAAVIVTAVGTSRVYLGVHYPSDVAAGAVLGVIWLHGSLKVLARIEDEYTREALRSAVARTSQALRHGH